MGTDRKSLGILTLLALLAVLAAAQSSAAEPARAEIDQAVAALSRYEEGQFVTPLRAVEKLVRDTYGKPELRGYLEAQLAARLPSDATPAAKQSICRMLWIIGTDISVPALAALLAADDIHLVEMGCYALLPNRSPAASAAVREALPKAQGKKRIPIVKLLGQRRDGQAVDAITRLAADADEAVAAAALEALGAIGDLRAAQALAKARTSDNARLRLAAQHASLQCARHLAEAGTSPEAAGIYRALLAENVPAVIRRAAELGLAAARGTRQPTTTKPSQR